MATTMMDGAPRPLTAELADEVWQVAQRLSDASFEQGLRRVDSDRAALLAGYADAYEALILLLVRLAPVGWFPASKPLRVSA